MSHEATPDAEAPPLLRILKGDPSAAELAALVSVVSAMANAAPEAREEPPRSEWSARHRLQRTTLRPGPAAWRSSARPR